MFMMKSKIQSLFVMALGVTVFTVSAPGAQTCPDPVAADFRVDTLAWNNTSDLYGGTETGN